VTRTQRFELRLTAEELRHLDACAASLGICRTAYARIMLFPAKAGWIMPMNYDKRRRARAFSALHGIAPGERVLRASPPERHE